MASNVDEFDLDVRLGSADPWPNPEPLGPPQTHNGKCHTTISRLPGKAKP